jgi:hypothetical protein
MRINWTFGSRQMLPIPDWQLSDIRYAEADIFKSFEPCTSPLSAKRSDYAAKVWSTKFARSGTLTLGSIVTSYPSAGYTPSRR